MDCRKAACLRGDILPMVVVVAAEAGVAVVRTAGRSRSPWGHLKACPLSYWEGPLHSCRDAGVGRFDTLLDDACFFGLDEICA